MKSKRLAMIVLLGAAVIALIGPMSSAVAFFSRGLSLDVQVNSPATLVARGAAINVPMTVICTSKRADLAVQVTQRSGSAIAQGFAENEITCTGDLQQVTFTATAQGRAFKKGPAVAEAQIFGCGFGTCGQESDTAQIIIVKK
jgi:hypothetical protein